MTLPAEPIRAAASNHAARRQWCVLRYRLSRVAAVAVLAAAVGACGGGGGGDTSSPASPSAPAAPAAALVISSFAPATARVGEAVVVSGSGMDGVAVARVGGLAATYSIESPTRLQLTVPAGAQTGRIELVSGTRTAISAVDLQVAGVPQALSVAPPQVAAGGRVVLSGTELGAVREVRLGTQALVIVAQSATSLTLDLPPTATSGFLVLVDALGAARTSVVQVTVLQPIVFGAHSPSIVAPGGTLSISGSGLDRVTGLRFASAATATVASRTGSTGLTVVVPDAAASGIVTLIGDAGEEVPSPAPVTVVPRIVVDRDAIYRLVAGAPLLIDGTGLGDVSTATVGGVAATIAARTDSRLTIGVPAGVACGAITLLSEHQPSVPAGTLIVDAGCSLRVAGLEFAQVASQEAGGPYQRLVPGKETWVRAYVVSATANTALASVRLNARVGGTLLGTIDLAGPALVPVVATGAVVPDAIRYDLGRTYNVSLPANWVATGLQVEVVATPAVGEAVAASAQPQVGSGTRLELVLVPLVSGPYVPQLPLAADVVDELVRRMPLDRADVTVSVRAPVTLAATSNGVDTQTEWSAALSELERLRSTEAAGKSYFGFVAPVVQSGIAGIGYVNSVGSRSPALSALGWDASRSSWRRTFTHELGHNFGRGHAPCGNPANPDPSYPYAGGALPPVPLFESIADRIDSPVGGTDVMGYCSGSWFSDYNLREVQRFLEARPQALVTGQALAATTGEQAPARSLMISGAIEGDAVRWAPPVMVPGEATPAVPASSTPWRLRIALADGGAVESAFEAVAVDHAPGEMHFVVRVPDPGPVAGLEVLRDGRALAAVDAVGARAQAAPAGAEALEPVAIDLQESAGRARITWPARRWPYLSVSHAGVGATTVLLLARRGVPGPDGTATVEVDVGGLEAGGRYVLSLGDGLNARAIERAR